MSDVPACVPLGVDTDVTAVDCADDCGKLKEEAIVEMLVSNVVFTGVALDFGGDGEAAIDVVVVETA